MKSSINYATEMSIIFEFAVSVIRVAYHVLDNSPPQLKSDPILVTASCEIYYYRSRHNSLICAIQYVQYLNVRNELICSCHVNVKKIFYDLLLIGNNNYF